MKIESNSRRQFTRIHFNRRVNLHFHDNKYSHCQIKNLSLTGMFVIGTFHKHISENCYVDLVQTGISIDLTLQASAKVVRANEEGIAFEFTSMAFDSYMFLQTTLLYEAEDPLSIAHDFPDNFPFLISDQLVLS